MKDAIVKLRQRAQSDGSVSGGDLKLRTIGRETRKSGLVRSTQSEAAEKETLGKWRHPREKYAPRGRR